MRCSNFHIGSFFRIQPYFYKTLYTTISVDHFLLDKCVKTCKKVLYELEPRNFLLFKKKIF